MTNKPGPELTWTNKYRRKPLPASSLREHPEHSHHAEQAMVADEFFDNRLIFSDNLPALTTLETEFGGKIRCVFLDPPYNTGTTFRHYNDGAEHGAWLSAIRDRLERIKRLLTEDGSLWITIDDREAHYLKVLCDEVFGRTNFIASPVWQKRYSRENRGAIGDAHEYILVYARQAERFKTRRNLVPITESQAKIYKNPNHHPRGRWRSIPLTAQGYRSNQMYTIVSPNGTAHRPPAGRCWSVIEPEFNRLLDQGKIWFGKNGTAQPSQIRFLDEVEGFVPWTWWPHDEVGHTDEAKKEMHALFGKNDPFGTPKPERLLHRILHIATNPGDFVLDAFAGSGTTGAVAHKMGRRWIMIEQGAHCHSHILPRLRQVVDGQDSGGVTEATGWRGGGGFRYFESEPA
ncbi:adenine-specific DNA-methyltransferase [uncultured Gammaproteobacteria bacterium]